MTGASGMKFEDLKAGDAIPAFVKGPVTRQHLVEWCAAENDYYHLHYDERVAGRMNLPGTPIQGTYKFALLGQMLTRWIGADGSIRRISGAYRGLSLEGDTLTCGGNVVRCERHGTEGLVDLELWVAGSNGERSTTGRATISLPIG